MKFVLLQLFYVIWAILLCCSLVICSQDNILLAFVMAVIFGAIFGLNAFGVAFWRQHANTIYKAYEETGKKYSDLLDECQEKAKAELVNIFETFYEGSPIENFVIQVKEKALFIKIGDGDCMVPVDVSLLNSNPMAALEQAQMAWTSAKQKFN